MLNSDSPVSMYYQLKEIIIDNIRKGVWPPKTRIPSEPKICEMFNVSRITVRRAIEELSREGYVYRVQGKGTFVRDKIIEQPLNHFYSFREELREKGIEAISQMKSFSEIPANKEVAENLNIDENEPVFCIERIFKADRPYASEVSYIPKRLCPGLTKEQVETNGLYKSMGKFNIFPDRARETLKAINLTKKEAEELQQRMHDACIYLKRVAYCRDIPVEYNLSIVRGDMFIYSVELNR